MEYVPGPIQALISWLILAVSTIITYFKKKEADE